MHHVGMAVYARFSGVESNDHCVPFDIANAVYSWRAFVFHNDLNAPTTTRAAKPLRSDPFAITKLFGLAMPVVAI